MYTDRLHCDGLETKEPRNSRDLRNRRTSPGNSWAWGGTESYAFIYSRTIVCANFRPRELRKAKLQFKFDFHSSCINHSATSLSPCILYTLFSWYGKHWFTPSSDWMDFDSGTFAG